MSRSDSAGIHAAPPAQNRSVGVPISFKGVSRHFGKVRAVDGVSLDIAPGEFFTLLGASGSGKTTVLQLLAGFQHPDAGQIVVDGKDIAGVPPFRRNIGVVFQSYALFPHLSVAENVAFPLRIRKLAKSEIRSHVEAALALVHLGEYGGRKISQLSGGQRQRVALARAIVYRPPLLLMDEPLSALDAKLRHAMQAELKTLHRELGVTVVYVTHDQREALSMSNRIAVLRHGRLEQVATPADLYEYPETPYVADFIGDANVLAASVESADSHHVAVSVSGHPLRARSATQLEPGVKVSVAIRPERIRFTAANPDDNQLAGRVVEVVYAGDHTIVHVEIAADVVVRGRIGVGEATSPVLGEAVTVCWNPDDSVALSDRQT